MGKKLCLIGFNADLEKIIKQFIVSLMGFDVEFVFANNKNLDGLVINAGLIDSPQIRKFISTVNVPIVCIHNTHEGLSKATYNKIFSISLQDDDKKISRWLDILLGKDKESQELNRPMDSMASFASPDSLSHQDVLNSIIRHRSVVFCAKFEEMKTWIKPAENNVFIDYQRGEIPPFEFWSFYDSTSSDIPEYARPLRLNLWLFETIWQSNINGENYVDKNIYYRLNRWPQPLGKHLRTEALRLAAACQQNNYVDIEMLQEKTGYPRDMVARFVFAVISSGLCDEIKGGISSIQQQKRSSPMPDKQEKKSFLQRLRAKLGF